MIACELKGNWLANEVDAERKGNRTSFLFLLLKSRVKAYLSSFYLVEKNGILWTLVLWRKTALLLIFLSERDFANFFTA